MKKIRLAIIFGGKSTEHEVSMLSASSVISAIDKEKYNLYLIHIDKKGKWHLKDAKLFLDNSTSNALTEAPNALVNASSEVFIASCEPSQAILQGHDQTRIDYIDVVFPLLHGPYGEDGTIQGLLKSLNIPFVGPDVLGAAIGMDKDVSKRLLREAGIPVARCVVLHESRPAYIEFERIIGTLGLPLFVKPANAGSSVGVHKVSDFQGFKEALADAFLYDKKVLVEEAIVGREVECAVLGNDEPVASVVGEIVPKAEFYSYSAKYIDENGAKLIIPAEIEPEIAKTIQETSIKAFKVLCCEGLSRVDFFLKPDNSIVLNEINTIPGFTQVSMYPKLFEVSGIPYKVLIDRLIDLSFERHNKNLRLKTNVDW